MALLLRGQQLVSQQLGPVDSVELTTLLTGVQSLVLHHSLEHEQSTLVDDNMHHLNTIRNTTYESLPSMNWTENLPAGQPDLVDKNRTGRFRCPHEDCEDEQQTFSRQQDLERHYAIRTVSNSSRSFMRS